MEGNRICLTMIVKNESKIIERLLDSCRSIVDVICICDTGSTDNTVELIKNYGEKYSIPTEVPIYKFRDFGYNRTASVEEARTFLTYINYDLKKTWLLLLDADMCLQIEDSFRKEDLKESGYLFTQKTHNLTYENTRLVRADILWTCVGVTHEYWNCPSGQVVSLKSLWIDDYGDGGSKAEKFERDIRLLTKGLEDDPKNGRYAFYLAQSYQNSGQHTLAIEYYKKRIEMGGWEEETWYAMWQMGRCYFELKKEEGKEEKEVEKALFWYQQAFEKRPHRAEPLKDLAAYYRGKGQNQLAYMFARQGADIPFPKDDKLFISHDVYNYELFWELSIVSY